MDLGNAYSAKNLDEKTMCLKHVKLRPRNHHVGHMGGENIEGGAWPEKNVATKVQLGEEECSEENLYGGSGKTTFERNPFTGR